MFRIRVWQQIRSLLAVLLVVLIGLGTASCGKGSGSGNPLSKLTGKTPGRLSEVAPPALIQELRQTLEVYQPQVKILSPRPDEVLQETDISVKLKVQDFPVFKNETFGLGPHLHLILDNQPYQAIYDLNQAIVLKDLAPGTHTLRVFASRPWHESFKNEGAFAQTTFHLFTKTPENNPDSALALLTYSRPKDEYGAEPIMLDFYLTNAPLHIIAQENSEDEIPDWKVRCTINGESFVFDTWQPVYLKGFKPGRNWVQLELLDENEKPIANAFNNTVRLINYQPGGEDTLSRLTRGELALAEVKGIVDANYTPPVPEAEPTEPAAEPAPEAPAEPAPEAVEPPAAPATETPAAQTEPAEQNDDRSSEAASEPAELTSEPTSEPAPDTDTKPAFAPATIPVPVNLPAVEATEPAEVPIVEKPEPQSAVELNAEEAKPQAATEPSSQPEEKVKEQLPQEVEAAIEQIESGSIPEQPTPAAPAPSIVPAPEPAPLVAPAPAPAAPAKPEAAKPGTDKLKDLLNQTKRFVDRFRKPAPAPSAPAPTAQPSTIDTPAKTTSSPAATSAEYQTEADSAFDASKAQELPPTLPEAIEAPTVEQAVPQKTEVPVPVS